jgi:hypothetical protein
VSDSDEELLIKVFFTSPVHVRKIMVIGGGEEDHHPSHLKASEREISLESFLCRSVT